MQKKRLVARLKFIVGSISLILLVMLLVLSTSIGVRLAIAQSQFPDPQAIFTLGGDEHREEFTAQFAHEHPDLPIWVSSGVSEHRAQRIFQSIGISSDRLTLDRRAVDTVTNFTTLVNDFHNQGIRHVYLITSDFHMRRARAIAFFVFGSRGIVTTPIAIPSRQSPETVLHVTRDIGRSLLWIATGRTGASLNPDFQNRIKHATNSSLSPSFTPDTVKRVLNTTKNPKIAQNLPSNSYL